MRIHPMPADTVSARLREPSLAEPREQRAYHQDRTAQRCAFLHEIFAFNVFSINVIRLEAIYSPLDALYLDPHALQQVYQVLDIQNFRNIAYDNFLFGQKHCTDHFEGLILRSLRHDFAMELMAAFYYECTVVHLVVLLYDFSLRMQLDAEPLSD